MKFILFLAFCTMTANATIVYFDSNALTTFNNSGDPTEDLTGSLHPNPAWAAALPGSDWISYGSTGDPGDPGYFSPPDGLTVTFTTQFTLIGSISSAEFKVLADDTTSVILNGHVLATANTRKGRRCAKGQIGCLTSTEGIFTSAELLPYLIDGTNTLSFGVVQANGSSFGLDFSGRIDDGPTPEPLPIALIGCGLIALAAFRRSFGTLCTDAR